jgi:hypothetical protein
MLPNTVSTHDLMILLWSLLTKRIQGSKVVHSENRVENTIRLVAILLSTHPRSYFPGH